MPSISMMSDAITPETLKKEKKMKSETLDSDDTVVKKEKSSSKKKEKSSSSGKKDKEEKEKKKKRKAVDLDDSSDKSDNSSELVQADDLKPKKAKVMEEAVVEAEDPNSLSNFRISKPLKDVLISKGIKALFPIQAMTFDNVIDGCDLVGRARTGQVCFR